MRIPSMHRAASAWGTASVLAAGTTGLLFGPVSAARAQFTYQTLGHFDGDNGKFPIGGVAVDSAGNVYGTASSSSFYYGETGTVWEIRSGSQTITPLVHFTGSVGAAPGANPQGGVVLDAAGNLFGTTFQGGGQGVGVVFELDHTLRQYDSWAFSGADGSRPAGPLVIDPANGNLFGATLGGGSEGVGEAFVLYNHQTIPGSITSDPLYTGITAAASFTTGDSITSTGFEPVGPVVYDGFSGFWGTTVLGGPFDEGTAYHVDTRTGVLNEYLGDFSFLSGLQPTGLVRDSAGNFWGTTLFGGLHGQGVVFEITPGTHYIRLVASFDTEVTGGLVSAPVIDDAGNLYGTANIGGEYGAGTIWALPAGSTEIQTLVDFGPSAGDPHAPAGGVFLDSAGDLFGTTSVGGAYGFGTVFELTRTGPAFGPRIVLVPEPGAVASGLAMFGATGIGLLRGALARRRRCPMLA